MEAAAELTPFEREGQKASENWTVTDGGASLESAWVNAEAGTGSRYSVQVSLCPGAMREGGLYLITVIQPWRTSMVVADLDPIHLSYAMEKLMNPVRQPNQIHGGDAVALQRTVNYALKSYAEWTNEAAKSLKSVIL